MTDGVGRGEGLLASLRGLVHTLIAILRTRLALVASDLEEQAAYLSQILVFALVCAMGVFFATALGITFVIAAFWDVWAQRLIAIGVLFALFLALALWSLVAIRTRLAQRPKLLAATLAELDKDKRALTPQHEDDR